MTLMYRLQSCLIYLLHERKLAPATVNSSTKLNACLHIVEDREAYCIKCDKKARPKKHDRFISFVKSRYKLNDETVDAVRDKMIADRLIEINDDKVRYLVDDLPF
jgi:hypothetical protein